MSAVSEIIRCSNFAAIKHKEQRRKDKEKTPYINHPIGERNFSEKEVLLSIPLGSRLHCPICFLIQTVFGKALF